MSKTLALVVFGLQFNGALTGNVNAVPLDPCISERTTSTATPSLISTTTVTPSLISTTTVTPNLVSTTTLTPQTTPCTSTLTPGQTTTVTPPCTSTITPVPTTTVTPGPTTTVTPPCTSTITPGPTTTVTPGLTTQQSTTSVTPAGSTPCPYRLFGKKEEPVTPLVHSSVFPLLGFFAVSALVGAAFVVYRKKARYSREFRLVQRISMNESEANMEAGLVAVEEAVDEVGSTVE